MPNTLLPSVPEYIYGILMRVGLGPFNLWGNEYLNHDIWSAHNPFDHTQAFRGVSLFVSAGNGSPGPLDGPGSVGQYGDLIEPWVLQSEQSFTSLLQSEGIPVTTDYYGAGSHSWPYWQREFHKSWPQIASALGVPA
jgi:S-formylglutathione hydrolase FrmB